MIWSSSVRACGSMDRVSKAEKMELSTKRKAEGHLRAPNQPHILKCGGSQADSERDSGFSGSDRLLAYFNLSWVLCIPPPLLNTTLWLCLPCRCKLGALEHNGDDGLGGFTSACCAARITWFGPTPLSGGCGGRLLLWTLAYDHNEQRLAQAGKSV